MTRSIRSLSMLTLIWGLLSFSHLAVAQTRLKDICRVKGQEENTLHGLGLVVGLKGTGDGGSFLPEIRSLARLMQLMGNNAGANGPVEFKDVKNVALVAVTATVPAAGARQGDQIDCQVMSLGSSKSLVGGRLFATPLIGPQPDSTRVYAIAQGALQIDDPKNSPTTARVHAGCQLEEDFFNPFVSKDGKITLVLNKNHADFELAWDIAERINTDSPIRGDEEILAKALDQVNIEVIIPQPYREDPVSFLAVILSIPIADLRTAASVFINESTGAIVIGDDVEIGSVVVTHNNIVVETGGDVQPAHFSAMHADGIYPEKAAKLKALAEALNAVKVPAADMVDIIKGLDRLGKLHGRLIIE